MSARDLAPIVRRESLLVLRSRSGIELNGILAPMERDLAAIRYEIREAVEGQIVGACSPAEIDAMLETAFAFLSIDLGQYGCFDLRGNRRLP